VGGVDGPSGERADHEAGSAADSTDGTFSPPASSHPASSPPIGEASPVPEEEGALGLDAEFLEAEDEDDEGAGRVETIDEEGRRRVRLAAPEGTDELLEKEAPRRTGLPDWAERWRTRSAAGTVLTAVAFGLQQVFEPERKEPAIVMETSGDPPADLPVEAELEQLGPRQSTVKVRPWLLASSQGPSDAEAPGEEPGEQ
jgi:hypothetical protein